MSDPSFDFQQTDQDDLTTGASPWGGRQASPQRSILTESFKTDIAVIGGGITGALVAEHLSSIGRSVVLVDREDLGRGSTQASTAMLQWEIDASVIELTEAYGFEVAARVYQLSRSAAGGLTDLVAKNGLPCAFRPRSTVYLSGNAMNEAALREEFALRERAGLPSRFVMYEELKRDFGFDREAAITSPGSAEADPLLLCWALLDQARERGVQLMSANALHFHDEGKRVIVETDGPHVIEANAVVLATGYVMPHFPMPDNHAIASSFAIATEPQPASVLWQNEALVWEAADPYCYMRTTADHRIIIGGEDEDIADPAQRDAMLPEKAARLQSKLRTLLPDAGSRISNAWCGAFGETGDGLPLIGPVPNAKNIYAAYGYGGNGITFSFLASRMIAAMISGEKEDWFEHFALDRNVRSIVL